MAADGGTYRPRPSVIAEVGHVVHEFTGLATYFSVPDPDRAEWRRRSSENRWTGRSKTESSAAIRCSARPARGAR
jgi:hypothetical protein